MVSVGGVGGQTRQRRRRIPAQWPMSNPKWSKTDQKKGLLVVSLSPFPYFYGHVTGFEDASAPILGHVKSTQRLV